MYYLSPAILSIAAIFCAKTMGAPYPEAPSCAVSEPVYQYTVTSQKDVPGTPQVGDYSVSGASGGKSFSLSSPLTLMVPIRRSVFIF